jgi:hypothetical protein
MIIKYKTCTLLAGLLICAAANITAEADTIVTFSVDMGTNIANSTFTPGTDSISVHGTFNGWGAGVNLVQQGSSTVYTNTVDDTTDANGGTLKYKFVNSNPAFSGSGGYENLCDGGGNRCAILPSLSGSSLNLPTPFYADSGAALTYTSTITFQVDMSQQINIGAFDNASDTVTVVGNFNGWNITANSLTLDPSIMVTNQPSGVVTSNVYTGTFTSVAVSTNAHMAYQFGIDGNYADSPLGNNNDGGNNRFFTMLPNNQILPVAFIKDAPFSLIYGSNITFTVDMTIVALTDTNFNPASLTVNGNLMGWGGIPMTNNPSAANTNIYYGTVVYSQSVGTLVDYQYRYTLLSDASTTIYDHALGGGDRQYVVRNVPATNLFSVFNDASLSDIITRPTPVMFTVDMNGAQTTPATGSHVFVPGTDKVYINGTFANWYAWSGGVNPVSAPPGYEMIQEGSSTIYTNTLLVPPGPVSLSYKYGIDVNQANGGPADNEAASGQNHNRVVRSQGFNPNPYTMATDKFGTQYSEPVFNSLTPAGGDLAIGAVSGGTVPVSWLGRPGAQLQVSSSLTSGWQSIPATDGTNWTAGYFGINGLVSVTNYPSSGQKFFRLIKP